MKRCEITFESLADYQDGRATPDAASRLRAHLDTGCDSCQQNLAWLQGAAGTLREVGQVQVPEPVLARARSLFRERFRVPERLSWLARLQFDSRTQPLALVGARGAKREGVQLVYSTEAHDIDLFQEPNAQGTWYLIGQIMPKEGEGRIVPQAVVLTGSDDSVLTVTPESDEFHVTSVPAGVYQITLQLADGAITLSDVGIGS